MMMMMMLLMVIAVMVVKAISDHSDFHSLPSRRVHKELVVKFY